MSLLIIKDKLKKLADLNYVEGKIVGVTYIKHKEARKGRNTYSSVLVLSIQGSHDKFGFPESSEIYNTLSGMKKTGRNAKIYYDSSGERIEFDVTMHVFDLTIGNYKVIEMSKKKREGWPVSLIFFSGTLVLFIMLILALRQYNQKARISKKL